MTKKPVKSALRNEVRIIGGALRSRKVSFCDAEGLRPTPDRIRETLFNWLMAEVPGARCLDLFAGSGVLGFESLSRGAARCVLVEKNPANVLQLRAEAQRLSLDQCAVLEEDALALLRNGRLAPEAPFHIVFVDPPYRANLWEQACSLLLSSQLLAPGAFLYLESDRPLPELKQWAQLTLWREKLAGKVHYQLWRYQTGEVQGD